MKSSFGFVNAFHKYRVNMSTFVRNFSLAQWTTTVVCIAPGLKMAQTLKLWRLHKYVLYMYCPTKKKEPSWWCTMWYRRMCRLILLILIGSLILIFVLPWAKKKNHLDDMHHDYNCDIEESAVWFSRDASMHEVAAVVSGVRSRFCSWIKRSDSSISQDSDFMHQQHRSFFVSRVADGGFCGRESCQWLYMCEVVLPSTVQSLFSLSQNMHMGWKVKLKKKKRKHCIRRAMRVTRFDTIFWLSGSSPKFLFFSH